MKYSFLYFIFCLLAIFSTSCKQEVITEDYTGSESCIQCHAKFYELWSTSHHGLAMQPITQKFIQNKVSLDQEEIFMENAHYSAVLEDTMLYIQERFETETKKYEVLWALGGKNVYYFLTPIDGGRLQTLPLAYNVNTNLWYNNPESAIRHFPNMTGQEASDEALPWKHLQYTFNTSCFSCHVSQLSNNYDLASKTYETNWKETGINCETCHGPAGEHVKLARLAEKNGTELKDLGLIVTSTFTPEQHNASCAPCHAKMTAITPSYLPGDKYFDNYDLITLENSDFYPDGRDLGENYTMTGWHMNPCAKEGELHCVSCHTSSGRYRFESDDITTANKACTSCHTKKEEYYEKHTHHKLSDANSPKCIDCHMPLTTFGHMNRSDHSFRPPMPKATMEFGSPNACNICHTDKDATWSQENLITWKKDKGYQETTLDAGRLIVQARISNWDNIDEIIEAIKTNRYGEVFTTSFLRLLSSSNDPVKKDAAIVALDSESPLVRSAAAGALYGFTDQAAKTALFKAANDEILLVRLSAATSLSFFPTDGFTMEETSLVNKVTGEYTQSLLTRPDDWSSHYNLGNHYQNMGQTDAALLAYKNSSEINPEAILPLVNGSFLSSLTGDTQSARVKLEQALQIEPMNEAVNFNYGLLMAELKQMNVAEKALRNVLEVNENNEAAAYNLAIIVSANDVKEAIKFSGMAAKINSEDPKYGYTYAFFLNQDKQYNEAIQVLSKILNIAPDYISASFLLGQIYEENGQKENAIKTYETALQNHSSNQQAVQQLIQSIARIKQ